MIKTICIIIRIYSSMCHTLNSKCGQILSNNVHLRLHNNFWWSVESSGTITFNNGCYVSIFVSVHNFSFTSISKGKFNISINYLWFRRCWRCSRCSRCSRCCWVWRSSSSCWGTEDELNKNAFYVYARNKNIKYKI